MIVKILKVKKLILKYFKEKREKSIVPKLLNF